MVFSEELGYDPDEWEECPPADHFLVFAPFTRLVLSLSAIGFAVFFFWLIDNHNKVGKKKEDEEEKVATITPSSASPPSSDLLSTITGFLTGAGRTTADSDFVQRSFRDEERSPAAAAAAASREQAAKIDLRPDELSSSFHYKSPDETKTAAEVRAEMDQASFELRDLLGDQQAPPVPPHRIALPDWSSIDKSLSDLPRQTQEAATDAAHRAKEFLGEIQPPTLAGISEGVHHAYDRVGQTAHDAYDRAAAPVADAFDQARGAAHDAYNRAAEPAADAFDRAGATAQDAYDRVAATGADALSGFGQTAQETLGQARDATRDAYDRVAATGADAYDRAGEPLATAQQHAGQFAAAARDGASDAYDRFGQAIQPQDALGRAGQAAHDAYDRASEATGELYDHVRQAAQQGAGQTAQLTHDAYDRVAEPVAAAGAQRAADGASDAYERAQAAAALIIDPDTARLEDDFERVQRDLDNLMAEHQVPLGVIIPGASTSTSPAASHQHQQQPLLSGSSPIDEHVRQLTAGLLSSEADPERIPSSIPSLHDIYEERQRQMSPPMGSPVKIPTQEDRAALRHWEEELARKEQEKLSKLVDTIVGGDDISDIASTGGTEHLLPGDRISMYSQDSSVHPQQLQPLQQVGRRADDAEPLPASDKINQKIDQISSALEQSLLSEIEQLARQTSTMQAELARARDSEYTSDEHSEGLHDLRQDAFQPAGDMRFIPADQRADQPAPISHRSSERQSGESDDFVKITPPSHSGAPSPSPGIVCMSNSEEEQLKRLVEEYDVIGSSHTSTLKKDASAPGALYSSPPPTPAAPPFSQQQQQPLPSPTTAALLQEYETVQPVQQQKLQQLQQQHSPSPVQQKEQRKERQISPEEQAQLDQILHDFELTPGAKRKDVLNKPLPRTPPHTPENTLMDPFGRPILEDQERRSADDDDEFPAVQYMMTDEADTTTPTTELRFKLAPRGSIGDLKLQFPRLPSEAGIEVVDPAHAHLPKDAFLPSDLEDVLASLVAVDSHELFLPSQQPPSEAAVAAKHVAAHDLQQQQQETPILSGPTPEPPVKKESADSFFNERKPTVIKVEGPAAPTAVQQQQPLLQQVSLDLSQPLQPPMVGYDRPDTTGKTSAVTATADFVVRQQHGNEEDQFAAHRMKPQMMPAFGKIKQRPAGAAASATIPHEELQQADAIFQDALDYMHAQKQPEAQPPQATGFIMEEEMLSSHGENVPRRLEKSADGTSKLIKTNEIFERLDVHDDHDDMTYAPEIQSVEIPPDQLSETSELPHEDLPIDDVPVLFKSPEAQKLEAEIRAQESAMDEAKSAMQHRAALAAAPHIISMNPNKNSQHPRFPSTPSISSAKDSPKALRKQSSLLSILGVTSTQEMLLKIDSLEALSNAMRKAGLDSTNVIFGIDYTASNKYQGEESFGGHSLHTIHPNLKNPYQQVITILGRTLAPFTTTGDIPVFGFGDAKTSDWSVFSLKENGHCTTLEEVLKTYNEVTPTVELSGPTNFSPLIYQAIEICQRTREYHILVIIADGQVTNEKATRRAIVQACQYPLSIIVVGVGDGPWEMMRVFDESLPKRPWDNFHFVEFHEVCKRASGAADGDVKVAIQSLLEIPDQYRCICNLGLLKGRSPSIAHKNT